MNPDQKSTVRVLYVEDAIDQALLVKAFFRAIDGSRVTHAQDGDQAIRLIEDGEWDLLVTDLNLPGKDGFAVIRTMRQKSPEMPILVTTGYTQAQYEEQALRTGADQVMIKPLVQHDFVARVRSMVERKEEKEYEGGEVVMAIGGQFGDVEMGCGGTLMHAAERDVQTVIVPILNAESESLQAELKAAAIAAKIIGAELRVDRALFGDMDAQRELVQDTIAELRPSELYLPAPDDRDPSRSAASVIGREAAGDGPSLFAYETATTGLDFVPASFVDIRPQMVLKMEALATYQSLGAARTDLRPRMAQAYARYWGRFQEFGEVEAFEHVGKR